MITAIYRECAPKPVETILEEEEEDILYPGNSVRDPSNFNKLGHSHW
jgi:hypothetical protein